jgi:hypothetical protein
MPARSACPLLSPFQHRRIHPTRCGSSIDLQVKPDLELAIATIPRFLSCRGADRIFIAGLFYLLRFNARR